MKKSKTLICTLLTIMLLICVFTGCAKSEDEESYEAPQTATSTTQYTTQTTTQAYDNGYNDYEEETQTQYYHTAIEGCVIENQDGSEMLSYCEKCEACGYVSSSTHTITHSFGTYNSSFHCPQCGNMQSVSIETNQN